MLQDEIFSGTIAAKGRGLLQVKETGMQTKFWKDCNKIYRLLTIPNALQKIRRPHASHRHHWNRRGCRRPYHFLSARIWGTLPLFLLAISFSGSGRPRGSPAVMTITLSMGVKEMSNRRPSSANYRQLRLWEALR